MWLLALCAIAALEVGASFILGILLFEPRGELTLVSCGSNALSDWYTIFFNPTNVEVTLRCSSEAVYPFQSFVFVVYGIQLGEILLVRTSLCRCLDLLLRNRRVSGSRGLTGSETVGSRFFSQLCRRANYAALFFYPFLAALNGTVSGLLYYAFAYVLIGMALLSNAALFACIADQSWRGLLLALTHNCRTLLLTLAHCAALAYALVALAAAMRQLDSAAYFVALVPFPTFFYIATAKYTDPALNRLRR